jgi:hypothetical protein
MKIWAALWRSGSLVIKVSHVYIQRVELDNVIDIGGVFCVTRYYILQATIEKLGGGGAERGRSAGKAVISDG